MFTVDSLNSEQKNQVKQWAEAGDQLAALQKKMNQAFGIMLTYMDARLVILDLGIELISEKSDTEAKETSQDLAPLGCVEASVDEVIRPGFLASGKVTFSDGMKALWGVDHYGRLSIDVDSPSYEASDEDMAAFQEILRGKLKTS